MLPNLSNNSVEIIFHTLKVPRKLPLDCHWRSWTNHVKTPCWSPLATTRLPSNKNIYNNLTSSLKRTLFQLRNDTFSYWISSLTTRDGSLWRATHKCFKQKPSQAPPNISNSKLCKWQIWKIATFGSQFSEVFQFHSGIEIWKP